jgi:hypothetical protein
MRRDQVLDAQRPGDRRGDEAVGGGDDGHQVAGVDVLLQQRAGACGGSPGRSLRACTAPAWHQVGARKPARVPSANSRYSTGSSVPAWYWAKKSSLRRCEGVGVDGADAHQELAPLVVGVDRQQRVVEVKQREVLILFILSLSLQQKVAQQRQRDRALGFERILVERIQHRRQGPHVALEMGQQIG